MNVNNNSSASNLQNSNNQSIIESSSNISDESIIADAIQTTGAKSLIDIVKILNHIKEKTGKDVDENLAISILQKSLNNL